MKRVVAGLAVLASIATSRAPSYRVQLTAQPIPAQNAVRMPLKAFAIPNARQDGACPDGPADVAELALVELTSESVRVGVLQWRTPLDYGAFPSQDEGASGHPHAALIRQLEAIRALSEPFRAQGCTPWKQPADGSDALDRLLVAVDPGVTPGALGTVVASGARAGFTSFHLVVSDATPGLRAPTADGRSALVLHEKRLQEQPWTGRDLEASAELLRRLIDGEDAGIRDVELAALPESLGSEPVTTSFAAIDARMDDVVAVIDAASARGPVEISHLAGGTGWAARKLTPWTLEGEVATLPVRALQSP